MYYIYLEQEIPAPISREILSILRMQKQNPQRAMHEHLFKKVGHNVDNGFKGVIVQ